MRSIFLAIAIFATSPLFCGELRTNVIDSAENSALDYQHIILLPVNASKKLCVSIPKGFAPIQSLDQFGKRQEIMIEYIPKNEDPDGWSEIITLNKFIGEKIQARTYLEVLKRLLLAKIEKGEILSSNSSQEKSIEQSFFIMQYMHENNQEVIGAFYISGPYDLAGVQYTIRLKKDQTVADAVKKIESFFKVNSKVIVAYKKSN